MHRPHRIGRDLDLLDSAARVLEVTPSAAALLTRFQLSTELPASLPPDLTRELMSAPFGVPVVWRPRTEIDAVLGCTRYLLGNDRGLLLMSEITEKQRACAQRLHQQRLQETGRFAALMAHDLRSPLSSIVYNVDLLHTRASDLPGTSTRELLRETLIAADQMRRTIAALLDFVRMGPPVSGAQALREIFGRVSSLLRPVFRAGSHELSTDLHDDQVRVRGNPLTIEQIFVNLLVNATEAIDRPVHVHVASEQIRSASTRTRAILMSGYATARDYQRAIECGAVRVLCKPFTSSELLQAIRQAVDCGTGFRGSIHGLSLVDLLQMFHYARRSLAIAVDALAPGHVFLEDGHVIHAVYRELVGEPALRAILAMPAGSLRTMVLPPSTPHSIARDFQEVLLDSLRTLDEDTQESPDGELAEFDDTPAAPAAPATPATPATPMPDLSRMIERLRRLDGYVAALLIDPDSGVVLARNGTGDSRKRLQALRDVVHHSRGERTSCTATEVSKVKKNEGPRGSVWWKFEVPCRTE